MNRGIFYNKVRVAVHLDRIRANWRRLHDLGGNAAAVIKSDAYGHGLEAVGRDLAQAGCRAFCVGTVEEGVLLRRAVAELRIVCLLGAWDREEVRAAREHRLVPFVPDFEHLERLAREFGRDAEPFDVALKFDTGMERLGFGTGDIPRLLRRLEEAPGLRVRVVASHLATADMPEQKNFVLAQASEFDNVVRQLRQAGLEFEASLANSAGLIAYPGLRHELQRPGISLYGANPFLGTPWQDKCPPLQPAMDVSTTVLQVHRLPKGRTVSYGRTFTAPRDMRAAVVAAGYADCWSRSLTSPGGDRACVVVRGRRAPILGRVCMQMAVVDVTDIPDAAAGDTAWLLGGPDAVAVSPDELAAWWGTITYEVFCLLGLNRKSHS